MSDELNALKAKLISAANSKDLDSLEGTLEAIKLLTETEKIASEKEKLELEKLREGSEVENLNRQARLESARLWLPITVPAASAVLLAALTLTFQMFQLRKTTEFQKTTAEQAARAQQDLEWDTQWRGAIQTLSQVKTDDAHAVVAGVTFLAIFSASERYRGPAHTLALQYLAKEQDPVAFKNLCSLVFPSAKWGDLEDLATMNRSLGDRYGNLFNQLKDPKVNDRKSLESEEQNVKQNILILNTKILSAIKDRPPAASANLGSLSLFESNLKGVDFRRADIRSVSFANSDVTDADFGDITSFADGEWADVTWWKAKAMSPALLADLKARYPFREPKTDYWAVPTDSADYAANVARLESQIAQAPSAN